MSTVMKPAAFDWQNPDYSPVIDQSIQRAIAVRQATPGQLAALKLHYADNPGRFIADFGWTADPRLAERGLPTTVPFLLFPRQFELIEFWLKCWRSQMPGLVEKSRDMGCSWLAMAFACTMCLFHRGLTIGIGSATEDKVDRSGDPSSLLYKARMFVSMLPPEFKGTWDVSRHSAHMRLSFPDTGSALVGEAGDNIGRGGRASLFFVDEAAHVAPAAGQLPPPRGGANSSTLDAVNRRRSASS
jgi:phage terminase large subunit